MAIERVQEAGRFCLNFTATTTCGGTGGVLMGVLVAQSTSGTIKIADSKGTIVNTMNVTAGVYYPVPTEYIGTLTITVGGTLDATVFLG